MHAPVPMAAWPLAVTAAVAGVAVGSYLTVLNDRVLADRVLADRVLADRVLAAGPGRPGPGRPGHGWRRWAATTRPARPGRTAPGPRDDSARGRGSRSRAALLRSGGWDLLVELGTGAGFA